ncbi:DUF1828 domain-containing protein [Lactobacillus sp. ESL0731]|uniref:DUF1828 domain-containing protein n=1 Tax=unclassified Lactobacillus TaxID=2620435 RepID=UPI0023F71A95|nr:MULTISPECIES: DUF1828 domain-containing protein [unclassified Lactobacillus]WEV51943.1 DUF1828 domain-containing protein [Lactobacillus sp. ESL0700]WEV63074.1 DUF1828 domain-containing protein [Lactobacillus sp. ESL0731]
MIKELTKPVQLKQAIGDWIASHTGVTAVSSDTWEVATTAIDSYGDTVYCFVQQVGEDYLVTDDGRILFKLDPGISDTDLFETTAEIALGAGYDFNEENCEISIQVKQENLAQAIIKLAQLQVAISYLG